MTRRLIGAVFALCMASQAHALSCADFKGALTAINSAETKADVTAALVKIGVAEDDASNLERASPDVDVARSIALRYTSPKANAVCRQEGPKM